MGIERDRLRGAQGERPSEREGTSQHDPRFQKVLAGPEPDTAYKYAPAAEIDATARIRSVSIASSDPHFPDVPYL